MKDKIDSLYRNSFSKNMGWKFDAVEYEQVYEDTIVIKTSLTNGGGGGMFIVIDTNYNVLETIRFITGFD